MPTSTPLPDSSPRSAPAIISFMIIASWNLVVGLVFAVIFLKINVETIMVGILGGILSAETAAMAAITGYWLANSLNANRANSQKDAVIAQQAGSGPPPPAPAEPVKDGAP